MVLKEESVRIETSLNTAGYDGILFVSSSKPGDDGPESIKIALRKAYQLDKLIEKEGCVVQVELEPGKLVYTPVLINLDYDDVRSFGESGRKSLLRALKAGVKKPLIMLPTHSTFEHCALVTLLGVFEALYVNLQYREFKTDSYPKIKELGVFGPNVAKIEQIVKTAIILEQGRHVCRDIGGADPERMTPVRVEEYIRHVFATSGLSLSAVSDLRTFEREYPLFAAVNRAANEIERHQGRIIYLTYEPKSEPTETLFLIGKGVTYDTGGADIKAGGAMAGMSRDKCGAAAVAGFMKVVAELKPPGIKVVGILSMARNSVGENAYVSDEIIVSRSGARVRVGNTDAEGRMIMADCLCYAKELALKSKNPHLMTIATLTGHAVLAVGCAYSIVCDNAVASKSENAVSLAKSGAQIGDPFEISTIRREDYQFCKGKVEGEDLVQSNDLPSSRTPRGHQFPAAFLILASGLDKHGVSSEFPIKYSHLDIAGSAGGVPNDPTGAPVLALYARFLNESFRQLI